MLQLIRIQKNDPLLQQDMAIHYSQPKGFVGRQIFYSIIYDGTVYGHIAGGSATMHLPGRNEFFNIKKGEIHNIINNIFYHIEPKGARYPVRNFTVAALAEFRRIIPQDWCEKYGVKIIGFETLVELPRTGELYRRDGWSLVGQTKGYTCKRVGSLAGRTDNWTGSRVWDCENLRPKLVFCKKI